MLSVGFNSCNNVSFKRAIRPEEKRDYSTTIKDAKKYMGIENIAIVMHGSSFPVSKNDLFIGSATGEAAAETNDFLKMHGFDSIQLGPPGLISKDTPSPYNSSINSKNYLFCDMTKLCEAEYANILNIEDIQAESNHLYKNNSTMTNYAKAFLTNDKLFEKAYDNFRHSDTPQAKRLKQEYKLFKYKNKDWLENDAIFEHLKNKYKTEDFEKWPKMARNLITYLNDKNAPEHSRALKIFNNLKENNKKELGLYKFKQFIINKQEKDFIKENPTKLNYISDAIIGFSYRDYWSNQEAFLKNYRVGTFSGGEGIAGMPNNQIWDIPVINPKTIFKEDGSLGIGGVLIKQKFEKLLDTYQNIRIDHALGLIDPWIYNKNNVEIQKSNDGTVLSTNAHGAFLSEMSNSFDSKKQYPLILEKIILPIMQEKNLDKNDAVWESLGYETKAFQDIYYDKLNLPKIVDLKWDKGENQSTNNWLFISTHDNPPFSKVATNQYYEGNKTWSMNPLYLAGFLHPEKTNEEKSEIIHNLSWDTRARVITKYEELLRCGEKIQISFMDFFGLDKTYNKMGTNDQNNWRLRLSKNYQNDYYQRLEEKDWQKIALNMPGLLKRAVISKIYTSGKPQEIQNQEFQKMKPLINKLDYYENVLYEPESESARLLEDNNELRTA